MTEANPLASGINGAILTHIAIDTAPYTVLRYGIRELNARIVAGLTDLEVRAASRSINDAPGSNRYTTGQDRMPEYAKIELLKSASAKLQYLMDTTSPNDRDGVFVAAILAQSTFLLLKDLQSIALSGPVTTGSVRAGMRPTSLTAKKCENKITDLQNVS